MQALWERINFWLQSNAPTIYEDLLPGASEAEIKNAEELMGISFPLDFVESYRIHNGQLGHSSPLVGEWELTSLQYIIQRWQMLKSIFDSGTFNVDATPVGNVRAYWWHPKWIPIASNCLGDTYCLDMDPPADGKIGQIISVWHMDGKREVLADSFKSWLNQYANDLANGKYEVDDESLFYIE